VSSRDFATYGMELGLGLLGGAAARLGAPEGKSRVISATQGCRALGVAVRLVKETLLESPSRGSGCGSAVWFVGPLRVGAETAYQ